MIYLFIFLIITLITSVIFIIYYNSYSSIKEISLKMKYASDDIEKKLHEKYNFMIDLANNIKKIVKKKDYFKELNNLDTTSINIYELDNKLNSFEEVMNELKEDNKILQENSLYNNINLLDQRLLADKIYFNQNNNMLMKKLHSYHKLTAKLHHISTKTSFEIKEPINQSE